MSDAPLDLLLVHVPFDHRSDPTPELGLLYLGTVVSRLGWSVSILDGFGIQSQVFSRCERPGVRIVGFYVNANNAPTVARLCRQLRARFDCRLILGGPHATLCDLDLLEESGADVVVRGEGEETLPELMRCLLHQRGSLAEIPGISFQSNRRPQRNPDREPIKDLDALPFPDRALLGRRNERSASLISSRGCPYRCTFCAAGALRPSVAFRSPEKVLAEVRALVLEQGVRFLTFSDDLFTYKPDRVRRICEGLMTIRAQHPELVWYCQGRVDVLHRHPELLVTLRDAGLVRLQLGVESGCPEVLKAYRKRISVDQVREVIRACHEAGILSVTSGFIVGGPFETEESFEQSVSLAESLVDLAPGMFECMASILVPFPGTEIARHPARWGIQVLDPGLNTDDVGHGCFCRTEALSWERIQELADLFMRRVRARMILALTKLPDSALRGHLDLADHGVITEYTSLFIEDTAYRNWNRLTRSFGYLPFRDVPSEERLDWVPRRCVEAHPMADAALVELAYRNIALNPLGAMLFRLSAGKLALREIERAVLEASGHAVSPEIVHRDLSTFYEEMDRHRLIAWTRT